MTTPERQERGLAAAGLSLRRGARMVLEDVDLRLLPGERLAVVGPNGAGKSSLLRALSGELRPTAGTVSLDGRPLGALDPRDLARRRAVLPQDLELSLPLRVDAVVALGLLPHAGRLSAAAERAAVGAALRAVGAEALAGRDATTLSGGERQRVHLARCLAQLSPGPEAGARYLLLDEPTSALDLRHQAEVLAQARALSRAGTGVLAVLHDLNMAAAWADRVAVLDGGRLRALGAPAAVLCPSLLSCVWGCAIESLPRADGGPPLLISPVLRAPAA